MEVLYFIVLVGVLVFVHELGHFVWAKFFGVKVLKFSLGFGPTIAGFTRGDTEYVIAALPLGGYVRMLGESPRDTISADDEGAAFSQQALWKRVIIVVAGPVMNLMLPLALFFVVFLGDTTMTPAVIGTVYPDRPADGVLEPGDRVVEADGEEVQTFYELAQIIGAHPEETIELVVERAGEEGLERHTVELTPFLAQNRRPLDLVEHVGRVGIKPHHPLAVLGVTSPSSAAASAGLRTFDRVISVGGHPRIDRWIDLTEALDGNRGSSVPLSFLRPVRLASPLGGLVEMSIYEPHVTTVTPESGPGGGLSRAGLEPVDLYVSHVTVRDEGQDPGIIPGDRLISLDGRPLRLWATFVEDVEADPDRVHELRWRRGDQLVMRRYRLRAARSMTGAPSDQRVLVIDPSADRALATLGHYAPTVLDPPIPNPSRVTYAMGQAVRVTTELVELTVVSVIRLLQGRLPVSSLGGPLRVLEATEEAARGGALNYLSLMAFISINLGLINLLPIPMLDGGHLLFILIEAIARRPVSTRVREVASLIGLLLLIVLMVIAFKNDLERRWPFIVDAFATESSE